jgi:hypothetical protein
LLLLLGLNFFLKIMLGCVSPACMLLLSLIGFCYDFFVLRLLVVLMKMVNKLIYLMCVLLNCCWFWFIYHYFFNMCNLVSWLSLFLKFVNMWIMSLKFKSCMSMKLKFFMSINWCNYINLIYLPFSSCFVLILSFSK